MRLRVPRLVASCLLITVLLAGVLFAQTPQIAESAILNHLNAGITWYRQLSTIDQSAGQPSDVLYLSNARSQARQSLQLAFQAAQSISGLQSDAPGNGKPSSDATENPTAPAPEQQGLAKALQSATDRLSQDQAKLTQVEAELAHARASQREQLVSQRDALQGVIPLDKALQEQLQRIATFVATNERAQGGMAGKIAALKESVPEVFATDAGEAGKVSANAISANAQSASVARAQSSGLIGQAAYLLGQTREIHKIDTPHRTDQSPARLCNAIAEASRQCIEGLGAAGAQHSRR